MDNSKPYQPSAAIKPKPTTFDDLRDLVKALESGQYNAKPFNKKKNGIKL